MSRLACNICLRRKKQTQVDRLVKIVSSNYHDDEEQDILTVAMMIIRLMVRKSNLRLASWFSLSTSSQAIGRLASPSTCSLRLALRFNRINNENRWNCILLSFCRNILLYFVILMLSYPAPAQYENQGQILPSPQMSEDVLVKSPEVGPLLLILHQPWKKDVKPWDARETKVLSKTYRHKLGKFLLLSSTKGAAVPHFALRGLCLLSLFWYFQVKWCHLKFFWNCWRID